MLIISILNKLILEEGVIQIHDIHYQAYLQIWSIYSQPQVQQNRNWYLQEDFREIAPILQKNDWDIQQKLLSL